MLFPLTKGYFFPCILPFNALQQCGGEARPSKKFYQVADCCRQHSYYRHKCPHLPRFDGFFWSSPSACLPFCQSARGAEGSANKMKGKRKVTLYLVAPPQAAAVCSINSSFCWRTTFRNDCAVGKQKMSFRWGK